MYIKSITYKKKKENILSLRRNKQNRITTLSLFKQLICSLILIECIHSMYKCHHKYFLYLMKVKVLFIWTYEVIIIFLTPGSEKSIKKIQSHKEKQSTPFYPSFVESWYVRFK